MPRLRRREKPVEPMHPTEAICLEAHRPWPIARFIERGARYPIDHPAVRANPTYWRGLVPLPRQGEERYG
jgi:hypothetical protein